MKRNIFTYVALAAALLFASGAHAEMDTTDGKAVSMGIHDIAVQWKDVSGSKEKFSEYRDVTGGFAFNKIKFRIYGIDRPCFLDFKTIDPLQEDEYYRLTFGRHGKVKVDLSFDSIPHSFSERTLLFSGAGTGRLRIADQLQSDLQSVEQTRQERGSLPLVDKTGEDAAAQNVIRGMYEAADKGTFKLARQANRYSLGYDIGGGANVRISVKDEEREGTRVITAGTYERYPQGTTTNKNLGHIADLFVVTGAELAEPIDYQTTSVSLGAGVVKKKWLVDLDYTLTNFENENSVLVWDNPFRIADAAAQSATGAASNAFDRGRFVNGQLSLPPDSQSHDINLSGAAALPMDGRMSAVVGYGWVTQEQGFLPYTLNSGLNSEANSKSGVTDVTNPDLLPQGDLGGKVSILSGSAALTLKPLKPLAVTARYRYYNFDNESDEIKFPGYAGFGESFWRREKNDPASDDNVINEPPSYTKQTAELVLDYHIAKPLSISLDGGWEGWDREHLRIDSTGEYSVGGGVSYRPMEIVNLKAGYKYASREVSGYKEGNTAENPEAIGLVNYDWADRTRHKANARVNVMPMDNLDVGVSGLYMDDTYAEDDRFGLKEATNVLGALDVSYSPVQILTLHVGYSRDYGMSKMQSGAKDDAFISPDSIDDGFESDNFNPLNYWNTEITENVDTVGVGALVMFTKAISLDTTYNFSSSVMEFDTTNPNGTVKLANAQAQDWPNVESRLHEVRGDLGYRVSKNIKCGARYMFESYELDDFAWDSMSAYMAGASDENSTRFVFTDATYNGYEAHVGGVYLNYSF